MTSEEGEREMKREHQSNRCRPNTVVAYRENMRVEVLRQIEAEIEKEHVMQEAIDRGIRLNQWGPDLSVPTSAYH